MFLTRHTRLQMLPCSGGDGAEVTGKGGAEEQRPKGRKEEGITYISIWSGAHFTQTRRKEGTC